MTAVFTTSPASNGALHNGTGRGMRIDTSPGYSDNPNDDQNLLSAGSVLSDDVLGLSPNSFVHISDDALDYPNDPNMFGGDIMGDWVITSPPGMSQSNIPHSSSMSDVSEHSNNHLGVTAAQAQHMLRTHSLTSTLSSASHQGRHFSTQSLSPAPQAQLLSIGPTMNSFTALAQQQIMPHWSSGWTDTTPQGQSSTPVTSATHATLPFHPHATRQSDADPVTMGQASNTTYTSQYPAHGPWSIESPGRDPQNFYSGGGTVTFAPPASTDSFNWGPGLPFAPPDDWPATGVSAKTKQPQPPSTQWEDPMPVIFSTPPLVTMAGGVDFSTAPPGSLSVAPSLDVSSDLTHTPGNQSFKHHGQQNTTSSTPIRTMQRTPEKPSQKSKDSDNIRWVPYTTPDNQPAAARGGHASASGSKKPPGGRAKNSHLGDAKKEMIRYAREMGVCWPCALQRDECVPSEDGMSCKRCERRLARPGADVTLTCTRTKLPDLKEDLIPEILTGIYQKPAVEQFASSHIGRWYNVPIIVPCRLVWGLGSIQIKMFEFVPRDLIIEQAVIEKKDWTHLRSDTTTLMRSPPLGLSLLDHQDYQKYSDEIASIAWDRLHLFVLCFYSRNEDDFCENMLKLLSEFALSLPEKEFEHNILREVFKLLVVAYLLSKAITIDPLYQEDTLRQMESYQPGQYDENALPKLANRQLKHMFSTMRDRLTDKILKQLSQFLKSSKRNQRWTAAFCTILGLAAAMECTQRTVHQIFGTKVHEGKISKEEADRAGEKAVERIDERFSLITKLFRHAYHAKFNPLRDQKGMREHLGDRAWAFVEKVKALVEAKQPYLSDRQHVSSAYRNSIRYTARLQARFLLDFWT